ncbi:MAG: hypothetical protein ACYC0K_07905 [Thermoleophilia bacterium]
MTKFDFNSIKQQAIDFRQIGLVMKKLKSRWSPAVTVEEALSMAEK